MIAAGWVLVLASVAAAASQKDIAAGKHHLQKANAQAAAGKCDSAVHEYTIAYEKLHDPVVLFNRAECYRRLGQNDAAVSDYRAFLDAVPRAPNRAQIEERMAALQGLPPPLVTAPPPRPVAPPRRPLAPPPPVRAAPPPPVHAAAPPPPPPPPTSPVAAEAVPPPPPPAREPVEPAAAVVAAPVTEPPAPAREVKWDGHGPWWLWTALGVAVAGGAAGAYLASRSPGASAPATQLGNYKY